MLAWDEELCSLVNVQTGDPKWPCHALLLMQMRRSLRSKEGDNIAALQNAISLKAKGSMLIVAREVAWRRVRHRWRFRCEHLPAESNTIADSLSRLSEALAKPFPKEAAHAIQRTLFRARNLLSQDQCVSENSAKYLSQVSCNVGHWVCSHPSRIAFSVRCLSSLLPFGVSLRSVFCDYGFAHTRVSLRFLSRFCRVCFYPRCALQCNTTLGLFRPVSLGIFSAHSVGFVLTRDSVRCSVKRL